MKRISLFLALLVSFTVTAHAQVTFEFHTGSALGAVGTAFDDAEGSAQHTQGGITLTAEAFIDGVSAGTDMNGTASGFGINDVGGGDQTDRLDNINGIESLVFSFDVGGTFDSIDLRYIESSGTEEGLLVFDGGNTYQLNSVTATGSSDVATIGETFTAGQTITLTLHGSAPALSNFSLESFTVTSAVPEPSSFAALAGLAMLGLAGSRRRRALRLA